MVKEEIQIGIEAKLKPNMKVLAQATACLRSYVDDDFEKVLKALGLLAIYPRIRKDFSGWDEAGEMVYERETIWPLLADLMRFEPVLHFDEPAWVPPVMSDVPAGVKAPVQLTAWKVSALRLVARLEVRGYVTKQDFREIGLNSSRWYHHWLAPAEKPCAGPPRWIRIPGINLADAQHPAAFATLLEREREIIRGEAKPFDDAGLFADQLD